MNNSKTDTKHKKHSSKIAIIPARGGSKRIPRKNIKDFLGKPIIAYSLEAALKSKLFDEIMVSTDDLEIAETAKKYGANIPFMRSVKNSDDFATTSDVLIEVLDEYKKIGREFDYLCCIYPAAPFVSPEKIKNSYIKMTTENAESIIPVVKFSYPVQRALRITSENKLEYLYPENKNKRSQDLEPVYHDAGQFYWSKIKTFVETKSLLTNNSIFYILTEMGVQDIDTEEDWGIAEIKYLLYPRKN